MSRIELIIWCNTFLAIAGTYLNAKQNRIGFVIWAVTNAVFVIYNIFLGSYAQALLFSVYFGLAIFGWFSWGRQKNKQLEQKEEKA